MKDVPSSTDQLMRASFSQETTDRAAARRRKQRLLRRIRQDVATGDVVTLVLVRLWMALMEFAAFTFSAAARQRHHVR